MLFFVYRKTLSEMWDNQVRDFGSQGAKTPLEMLSLKSLQQFLLQFGR